MLYWCILASGLGSIGMFMTINKNVYIKKIPFLLNYILDAYGFRMMFVYLLFFLVFFF